MNWSALLTEVFKFLNNLFEKIFGNPKKQFQKMSNIYDSINRIIDESSVERFIIFKAHNGGGIIKPSGELYVSALYEGYCCHFHSEKWKYQKMEVDHEYIKMLADLTINKNLYIKTSEMKDSLLKGIYEGNGVIESRLYYLGQTKKSLFFASAATSKDWNFDSEEKSKIDIEISTIKQNLK